MGVHDERFNKAIDYFNGAIEKDPAYALAYAGLAEAYARLGVYRPPKEFFPKAKAAAMKALELDDTLSEAHTSVAVARAFYDWDWAAAERGFKRAIELNPSSASAHVWYGDMLGALGRLDESLAETKRGHELDPVSWLTNAELGEKFLYAGQYDQAIDQYRKNLELHPENPQYGRLGRAYWQKGMFQEAIAMWEKGMTLSGNFTEEEVAAWRRAYEVGGKRGYARWWLDRVKEGSIIPQTPYWVGVAYMHLGEMDQAFAYFEKAYEERRYNNLVFLKVEPGPDPLRSDPRYHDLLRRMNLPE